MQTGQYRVLFKGHLVEGVSVDQIRENLVGLGLSETQAEHMLAGQPATIRRQLSLSQAQAYQQRLQAAGIQVEIEVDVDAVEPVTAAAEPERFPAREPSKTADSQAATSRRVEPVRFTGNGSEYFGIWIVNIMLIIVTLGFYAPWAKVRNNQYFYGHTHIDGSSFQYLADPWVIFRGRLVAIVAVIIWMVVSELFPLLSLGLVLLFLIMLPWVVTRSLKFHAVNSAYRNIRFDFTGRYAQAAMVLLVWPLLSLLSLLLLAPLSMFKSQAFLVNNSRFGRLPFRFKAKAGDYYVFCLKMLGVVVGFVLLSVLLSSLVNPFASIVVGAVGYLTLFGFFMAGLTNLAMNSTVLGMHGFRSSLGAGRMLWIYCTNTLLIILTLGFFIPWAKVRMAHYRAQCTEVMVFGDLDSFIAGETQQASAMGQEIGEAFDVGASFI